MPNDTITAIAGVSVGHWTQTEGGTGCTVILFDPPVVAGVDNPEDLCEEILLDDAVVDGFGCVVRIERPGKRPQA